MTTRQGVVAATLVKLADSLTDDFDVVELLHLLTARCVEVFDVAAAGLTLRSEGEGPLVMATSEAAAKLLESPELQPAEGPGQPDRPTLPALNQTLDAEGGAWPTFARRARQAGYRSVSVLPMRLRERTTGALVLFRTGTDPMDEEDLVGAQAFADVATVAVAQHRRAAEAQRLNEQLHHALNSRIAIEQAKGIVAERAGVSTDQAFEMLRRHARGHNLKLADVVADVVEGHGGTGPLEAAGERGTQAASSATPPASTPEHSGLLRVLTVAEESPPADAVDAAAAELMSVLAAESVSFLMADLGGESLVRLRTDRSRQRAQDPLGGASEYEGAGDGDRLETVKLAGTPYERVMTSQKVHVVPEGDRFRVYAPVSDRGDPQGVLELVVSRQPSEAFLDDVEAAAHALAYVVIANRRHTDRFESVQRHAPFSLAAEIQRRLLPAAFTCETEQLSLAGWLEPAEQVGGDTFDYSVEKGVLHASMTDAMGRGVAAAQLSTLVVASLRNGRRGDVDLAEQAQWANDAMTLYAGSDQFVTGLLLRLDLRTGRMSAVNAGHPRPYRLRGGQVTCLELVPDVPLGAVVGYPYRVQEIQLRPGDRLVVVTDGVIGRGSPAAHLGVAAVVGETADLHPREVVHAFKDSVLVASEALVDDDAAILCIDWHGP